MTKESVDVDEIEVGVKSVRLSPKGDSVTVELILQSYLKTPRELKINSFATGVISPQGSVVFYDSMSIGNVKVQFKDRQNYIHYLLTRDVPVLYVIKTPNWQKRWGKPQQFRFTLEDHEEEGKFLQVDIDL
jgi:hypothetical protein